jgi:hypothetical protein
MRLLEANGRDPGTSIQLILASAERRLYEAITQQSELRSIRRRTNEEAPRVRLGPDQSKARFPLQ